MKKELSEEEKEFTKGYEEGYKDGLTDRLKPQEYKKEQLRKKSLDEALQKINKILLNAPEEELGDIEVAIELHEKIEEIKSYSKKMVGIKEKNKIAILTTLIVLAIGSAVWYFWTVIGFVVAALYVIFMWIGLYQQFNF